MGTKYLLQNKISNKNTKKHNNAWKTENKNVQSFQNNLCISFPEDDKFNCKKDSYLMRKNPNYEDFVFLYSSVEGRFSSIFCFKYSLVNCVYNSKRKCEIIFD